MKEKGLLSKENDRNMYHINYICVYPPTLEAGWKSTTMVQKTVLFPPVHVQNKQKKLVERLRGVSSPGGSHVSSLSLSQSRLQFHIQRQERGHVLTPSVGHEASGTSAQHRCFNFEVWISMGS